jgi:hypothetical protein
MGQKSKAYTTSLAEAMKKADTDVNRCQQFMIGIDGSRENMDKALKVVEPKMKAAPTKTFAELAKTDAAVKKAGETYERAARELDDYKTKFTKTIGEAAFSIEGAQTVIKNFQGFCGEKAKSWNPLKKKSLEKSLAALGKASTDLAGLRKFLDGIIDVQKQKGNIA